MRLAGKIVFKADGVPSKDPVESFDDAEVEDTPVPEETNHLQNLSKRMQGLVDSGKYYFDPPEVEGNNRVFKYGLAGTENWPKAEFKNEGREPIVHRYNPDVATPKYPTDGSYTRGEYDLQEGWSRWPTHEDAEPNAHMYRGMSHEEWEDAQKTGYIKSKGEKNIGQEDKNLTYYSSDIQDASRYGTGHAPNSYQPTPTKPGVLVAVPRRGPSTEGRGALAEIATTDAIPFNDISAVWHGYPAAVTRQGSDVVKQNSEGGYYEGSIYNEMDFSPAWTRIHDWRTPKLIKSLWGRLVFKANGEESISEDEPVEDTQEDEFQHLPDEARTNYDSGRYKFHPPETLDDTPGQELRSYKYELGGTDGWESVTPKMRDPDSGREWERPGRKYNPEIAKPREIKDDYGTRHEFDLHDGWSSHVSHDDAEPDSHMYRGMSYEEWEEAQKTGYIKSKGDYNLGEGQKGLTYFAEKPEMAQSYAHGFAPVQYQAAPHKPAVVVAVPRREARPDDQRGEIGVSDEIPVSDVTATWHGHPYTSSPGSLTSRYDRWSKKNQMSGSNAPSTTLAWKRTL